MGIVQKAENGIVYTVESNSGDSVRMNQYAVRHYEFSAMGFHNIKNTAPCGRHHALLKSRIFHLIFREVYYLTENAPTQIDVIIILNVVGFVNVTPSNVPLCSKKSEQTQ